MSVKGTFEALKYSLRQSKDGVVISLVIHPSDVSPELMALPIGARVEIEWTECTDEEPASSREMPPDVSGGAREAVPVLPRAAEDSGRLPKERRPFAELPLSQQCAIRCADKGFWKWLGLDNAEAVTRHIRSVLRVDSRSELDHDADAADKWRSVDRRFNNWLTTQQHGALAR